MINHKMMFMFMKSESTFVTNLTLAALSITFCVLVACGGSQYRAKTDANADAATEAEETSGGETVQEPNGSPQSVDEDRMNAQSDLADLRNRPERSSPAVLTTSYR